MRKLMLAALAVSGMALSAGSAFAVEPYSSNDVIAFFMKSANLGDARGICVGTAEECQQAAAAPGFDVLVTFELNSAVLTPQAVDNLKQVAVALVDPRLSGARFAVEGFTDASGSDSYNMGLSEQRAQSVKDFLVAQGVPAERLAPMGFGEAKPRVDNPYDPINRRVEMRIQLQ
jgi:outer membrane protein OmpA-like peptidoglycan-associated protein